MKRLIEDLTKRNTERVYLVTGTLDYSAMLAAIKDIHDEAPIEYRCYKICGKKHRDTMSLHGKFLKMSPGKFKEHLINLVDYYI